MDKLIVQPPAIPPQRRSYVSAAALSKTIILSGLEWPTPRKQPTVPANPEGKTSEQLQKTLTEILDPKKDGFQVVRTRKIKGSGLALQTTSSGGLDNIKKLKTN